MNQCLCPEKLAPFVAALLKMFSIKVLCVSDFFHFSVFQEVRIRGDIRQNVQFA